jgi:hypothetical protein
MIGKNMRNFPGIFFPMILETRDSGIREKEIASLYRMAKMRKKTVVAV